MAEEQLSVRSTEARKLAHELARREKRSVSEIVLDALKRHAAQAEAQHADRVAVFWADLDAIAARGRAALRKEHAPERASDTAPLYDESGLPV